MSGPTESVESVGGNAMITNAEKADAIEAEYTEPILREINASEYIQACRLLTQSGVFKMMGLSDED